MRERESERERERERERELSNEGVEDYCIFFKMGL